MTQPAGPQTIEELEDALSTPPPAVIEMMRRIQGDLLLLGVGGKMGPTLARMARRATDDAGVTRQIIGVSRFSSPQLPATLHRCGIETIRCDLLDEAAVSRLPDAPYVIAMTGFKFGTQSNPSFAWAMNCYLPAVISQKYRHSRLVCFSSGNVYPFVPVSGGGSVEADMPQPVGEYAMSVLGRERMYEHFSRQLAIPMAILRLNYATELRYGVLVDLARMVWTESAIDLAVGHVNVIWQAEANAVALQMLEHTAVPPAVINVAGSEMLSVRAVCEEFGRQLGRTPRFHGSERPEALLNNASACHRLFGPPQVTAQQMVHWIADWVRQDGPVWDKPTHFNSHDGSY